MMKPEKRGSFLTRSFRRSFKKKKPEEIPSSSGKTKEEEENDALCELRRAISDVMQPNHTDVNLLRILKSQKFDVKAAVKYVKMDLSFRRLLFSNNYEDFDPPAVGKYLRMSGIIGFDKEGALVRMLNFGQTDLKGTVHSMSTVDIMKIVIRFMGMDEKILQAENKKRGRNANQTVFIINLHELSTSQILHKPVLDTALLGLKLYQEHFYESWKDVFVINAPSYFSSVFKLLKPVILDELNAKLQIFGVDSYQAALLEHIDADVLPKFLGGNRDDYLNDPQLLNLVTEMEPIPQSFYGVPEEFIDDSDPDVKSLTIPAGGSMNISIPVVVPGSVVKYIIHSKDNDIGFGIFYDPNTSAARIEKCKKDDSKDLLLKLEQLTPIIRSQCHIKQEDGCLHCYRSGLYVVHFDNTYSWMSSKQVYYKIDIIIPGSEMADIMKRTKDLRISSANGTH